MRDDIKMLVYRNTSMKQEPGITVRVLSHDGMDEKVVITDMDMMRCDTAGARAEFISKAVKGLAGNLLLPAEDLLRMAATGENGYVIRDFAFPPQPRMPSEPKPKPKLETGWMGFLNGVAEAIIESHKNYVLPRARVVKVGKQTDAPHTEDLG